MEKTFSRINRGRLASHRQQNGFIQAALLFGIALMTAVLGGFALANRSPTSQTDVEQAKVNASVILKQASDLRDGVGRYANDYGASAVLNTMNFSAVAGTGLFDPAARYASPQIMPTNAFASPVTIQAPGPFVAGHWYLNKITPANEVGINANADPMVILPSLRPDVCARINQMLYGSATIPTSLGAESAWISNGDGDIDASAPGWPEGCLSTSDAETKYIYFKVVQEN